MKEVFIDWKNYMEPWLLTHGIKIPVIIIGAYILDKVVKKYMARMIKMAVVPDKLESKVAEMKREETLVHIFKWVLSIVIWIMAVLMVLEEAGVPIGPVLAGAGVIGLAVGFGGQYLIKDIISGFFIILENQYRIGDVINVDGTGGLVEDITLRMTTLRDLDGTVHHIPHGEIKKVSNLSKYFARVNLNVGIGYGSDLEHVIGVVNNIGNELASDPAWKEFIIAAPQFLRVDDFGDSSIVIKILGETLPLKQWDITGELRKRIKIAFDREGIEIPFPQRVVHQVG